MSQIVSAQVSGYLSGVELSPRDLRRVPAMTELLDSAVAEFSGVLRALGVDKLRRDRGSCPLCGGGRRRKDCFSDDLDRGLWICHRCGRSGGVLDLVEAGRPMAEIVEKLGVSSQTIYDWRDQDLVDRGLSPAVTTAGR